MKLNKLYLPDPASPLAAVVFLPLGTLPLCVGLSILVESLTRFDELFIQSPGGALLFLLFATALLLIAAAFFLFTVLGLILICRPLKFTEEGIERRLIHKELLLWSEVTMIGLTPALAGGKSRLPDDTICIASGEFSTHLLYSYGVLTVLFAMILNRHFPWLGEKYMNKLGEENCLLPEKMVWLYASEKIRRDIFKMWKERAGEAAPEL